MRLAKILTSKGSVEDLDNYCHYTILWKASEVPRSIKTKCSSSRTKFQFFKNAMLTSNEFFHNETLGDGTKMLTSTDSVGDLQNCCSSNIRW